MRCKKFGISLNPSKYIFCVTKGNLLGHIVSNLGIRIDPERIVAILNLPSPTSDVGASPTSSERGASANAFWEHDELFKNF
jgi:hypothetical protein